MKTLYKLDTKGKVRILQISTEGSKIVQVSGLLDGAKTTNYSECVGKNIGRSNETTPEEQAILEVESKITEKLKEGYFETLEEAKGGDVILPMLALDINKLNGDIDWSTAFAQPKLDGMRSLGKYQEMKSRTNTIIDTMPHIQAELDALELGFYLDGELYEHGKSFQENMSLIKKYRGKASENVKYHVYDLVSKTLSFKERFDLLVMYVTGSKHIELVPTYKVNSMEEVNKYHAQFLGEGYEGTIIRWGNEGYEINKRSKHLLKKKDFIDIDAKIIDIIPSEKIPLHGTPILYYNNRKFKSGVKMSHKDRENLLNNKKEYIGKLANIRFFEWTDDNIPRFPVMIGIHEDR